MINDNYETILRALKLQKSRALTGVKFGAWILCLESIEDAPVEVVFIGDRRMFDAKEGPMRRMTFRNLSEACKGFRSLDHFVYGMRGDINGKPALRFESPEVNNRLSN